MSLRKATELILVVVMVLAWCGLVGFDIATIMAIAAAASNNTNTTSDETATLISRNISAAAAESLPQIEGNQQNQGGASAKTVQDL